MVGLQVLVPFSCRFCVVGVAQVEDPGFHTVRHRHVAKAFRKHQGAGHAEIIDDVVSLIVVGFRAVVPNPDAVG